MCGPTYTGAPTGVPMTGSMLTSNRSSRNLWARWMFMDVWRVLTIRGDHRRYFKSVLAFILSFVLSSSFSKMVYTLILWCKLALALLQGDRSLSMLLLPVSYLSLVSHPVHLNILVPLNNELTGSNHLLALLIVLNPQHKCLRYW